MKTGQWIMSRNTIIYEPNSWLRNNFHPPTSSLAVYIIPALINSTIIYEAKKTQL
jgi:hypothetical protein